MAFDRFVAESSLRCDGEDVEHLEVSDPSSLGCVTQTTLSVDDTISVKDVALDIDHINELILNQAK